MAERKKQEMSFLDHLEELRKRLIKAVLAVVVGAVASWFFVDYVIEILAKFADPNRLTEDDEREPVPYRVAVAGFVVGTLLCLAWCRYGSACAERMRAARRQDAPPADELPAIS